jgi:hypothetical protein
MPSGMDEQQITSASSPTRLLLIGKQDAGFVRRTLKFCDDLTFDEYGANTCRRNWGRFRIRIIAYGKQQRLLKINNLSCRAPLYFPAAKGPAVSH